MTNYRLGSKLFRRAKASCKYEWGNKKIDSCERRKEEKKSPRYWRRGEKNKNSFPNLRNSETGHARKGNWTQSHMAAEFFPKLHKASLKQVLGPWTSGVINIWLAWFLLDYLWNQVLRIMWPIHKAFNNFCSQISKK